MCCNDLKSVFTSIYNYMSKKFCGFLHKHSIKSRHVKYRSCVGWVMFLTRSLFQSSTDTELTALVWLPQFASAFLQLHTTDWQADTVRIALYAPIKVAVNRWLSITKCMSRACFGILSCTWMRPGKTDRQTEHAEHSIIQGLPRQE